MKRVLIFLVLITFCATPLLAQNYSGTLKQIKETGKIRVGYRTALPPMSFVGENGEVTGYSIDIGKKVVQEVKDALGQDVAVEYVPVTAAERFDALRNNKIDILCGSATKTLSREKLVDFTQLTFVTGAALMTNSEHRISDYSGKKIGVVKGTTTADKLKSMLKEINVEAEVVYVSSGQAGCDAVLTKQIDAFAADQVVLIGLLLRSPEKSKLSVAANAFSFDPIAMAVRRNDADFRLLANRAIAKLSRSNEILSLYDKWFGEFSKHRPLMFDALYRLNAIPE